jgi:hypothetical protein
MRSFCSAPNGDFIAWFPDYFNVYNTLGVVKIQDIELQDFTIMWSDLTMVTHQFSAGTYAPISAGLSQIGGLISAANEITSGGVATIDFPALLENLLSLNPNDPTFSPEGIYNRFGARPNFQSLGLRTAGNSYLESYGWGRIPDSSCCHSPFDHRWWRFLWPRQGR